jgi:hypothetical protein
LLAGIDLLTGKVHALVKDRHRSREFIEFLKLVDTAYPADTAIHLILDNHSAHISRETRAWLAEQPAGRFEFTFCLHPSVMTTGLRCSCVTRRSPTYSVPGWRILPSGPGCITHKISQHIVGRPGLLSVSSTCAPTPTPSWAAHDPARAVRGGYFHATQPHLMLAYEAPIPGGLTVATVGRFDRGHIKALLHVLCTNPEFARG